MPTTLGDYEMRKGRMLTMPRMEEDGSIDFFGPPPTPAGEPEPQVWPWLENLFRALMPNWIMAYLAPPQPAPPQPPPPRSVGVMDVGQGNCNMLIVGEHPVAYFDLGFPLPRYAQSAPANLREELANEPSGPITQAPENLEVILSHWDWDHWYLGVEWPALQALRWVVPRQAMGVTARNFFNALQNKRVIPQGNEARLIPWPTEHFLLYKCHPRPNPPRGTLKNNSGLAMVTEADLPVGSKGDVVLSADANFPSLPPQVNNLNSITGITAAHHGSNNEGAAQNLPARKNGIGLGRIAYSCGCLPPPPNMNHPYNFPNPGAVALYRNANWGGQGTNEESSTAEGHPINEGGPAPGNVRMGDQTELNPQYEETAFHEFPETHRLV